MNQGRLLAAAIASVLLLLIAAGSIRWRMRSTTVIFVLLFGLPAAGFATYAVRPGAEPDLSAAVDLAIVLYAAGAVGVIYAIVRRIRRGRPTVWEMSSDSRRFMTGLIVRWLLVLWMSSLLYLFEPGFAVANVAVNLLWMLVWVPRRFRTWTRRVEADIAAPPQRVFEFVSDVRNWKLYRDDVQLVSVTPEGPLTAGSEYVARVPIPPSLRRTSYRYFESRFRVTAMLPGESFDTRLLGQESTARTTLEPTPTGTRLSRATETTMGLLRAWSADMLDNARAYAALGPREQRNNERLKEILESPSGG